MCSVQIGDGKSRGVAASDIIAMGGANLIPLPSPGSPGRHPVAHLIEAVRSPASPPGPRIFRHLRCTTCSEPDHFAVLGYVMRRLDFAIFVYGFASPGLHFRGGGGADSHPLRESLGEVVDAPHRGPVRDADCLCLPEVSVEPPAAASSIPSSNGPRSLAWSQPCVAFHPGDATDPSRTMAAPIKPYTCAAATTSRRPSAPTSCRG